MKLRKNTIIGLVIATIFGYFLSVSLVNFSTVESKELRLDLPTLPPITAQGEYKLDCRVHEYAALTVGEKGSFFPNSYIRLERGSEQSVIYIRGDSAQYFGGNFTVLQDDSRFLIILRTYSLSGITEVVTIHKESGLGFDTKTTGSHVSSLPTSDTYFLACTQL